MNAQETYFNFQGKIYSTDDFQAELQSIEKNYSENNNFKFTTASYKVRSMAVRQDSIIQNVEVILSQSNSSELGVNTGVAAMIEQPLPDFELLNLSSNLKRNTNYKGKVTLVNLWFTNCPPCITEIPYLNYLKDSYGSNVNFVAITFDDKDKVNTFLERKPFHFEHLIDAAQYLSRDLENNAFPKLILLDASGTIRFVENGVMLSGNDPTNPEPALTGLKEQIDFLLKQ